MNKRSAPLKIGIFGVGHLGKIHLKCLQQLSETYQIIGFHDPDSATAQKIQSQFNLPFFSNRDTLLDAIDVADIVAPTFAHLELALAAIQRGKHVFIEKPIANSLVEAQQIVAAAQSAGVKVQIGHVERFNPAFLALKNLPIQPMFIEGHRLATFNPRGTDVSVVLDLMIHDLDLILKMVPSKPVKVIASGVAVVSPTPDIT
ncbi:MAG: Gfo/Idh/MocA family protein, partial [Saprospiraceae bacterium]